MEKKWTVDTSVDAVRRVDSGQPSEVMVMGSTKLFEDGQIRYIPMPTPNPKDPLNLKEWRKIAALVSLCFFGALALSAESIIAALIPVFALEYAGLDPKILDKIQLNALSGPGVVNLNPLSTLSGLGGPPLWKVSLLSSLPLLTNGLANYFLVPLSISIGRRPVLLICGVMAFAGGYWAGFSTSLDSHLAARCFQGIGAGAVEALIPLAVQDLVFIHQRNRAISAIYATQGVLIVTIGITSPIIVVDLSWRYIYYITATLSVVAWIALFAFLPETRWERSREELNGQAVYPLREGETRPRLDFMTYGSRTLRTEIGFFENGFENKAALKSMVDTARSTFFPNILWVTAINSIFIAVNNAAGQVGSSVLIAAGWKFKLLGLAVVPIIVAAPFVWAFGGFIADWTSNKLAKRNGGHREAEAHLVNIIIPMFAAIIGCILFGYVGDHNTTTPPAVLLVSVFLISFGFLTSNAVLSVYTVESYPQWAGPVLVNVSSFRCIVGFAMSFRATTWIEERGFLGSFGIYAGVLGFTMLFLPLMYFKGKAIRQWVSGASKVNKVKGDKADEHSLVGISAIGGTARWKAINEQQQYNAPTSPRSLGGAPRSPRFYI